MQCPKLSRREKSIPWTVRDGAPRPCGAQRDFMRKKSFMLHEVQVLSIWNLDLKTILYFHTTIACGAKGRLGERPFEPRAFLCFSEL